MLVIYMLAMGCRLQNQATAIPVSEKSGIVKSTIVAEVVLLSSCLFRESSAGNKQQWKQEWVHSQRGTLQLRRNHKERNGKKPQLQVSGLSISQYYILQDPEMI